LKGTPAKGKKKESVERATDVAQGNYQRPGPRTKWREEKRTLNEEPDKSSEGWKQETAEREDSERE